MKRTITTITLLLAITGTANAALLFSPNNLARPLDGPDEMIMYDSSDPANFTRIGSMGVQGIGFGGLDFDGQGNLWAYASFYKATGGAAGGLYSVDINTGQATPQGTLSTQSLQDLAFNPVDGNMYGINTQINTSTLYQVDLASGAVTSMGVFTGLPASQHVMSFAIDSAGNNYVHDLTSDRIYTGSGLALTELYQIPLDTNASQGMTIDWSRDDMGYHAAAGLNPIFTRLNTFTTDGSSYQVGPTFGPMLGDGLPPVEAGDVAIMPVPEPASVVLLLTVGLLFRRR